MDGFVLEIIHNIILPHDKINDIGIKRSSFSLFLNPLTLYLLILSIHANKFFDELWIGDQNDHDSATNWEIHATGLLFIC